MVRGPGKKTTIDLGISKKQPFVQMMNVRIPALIVLIHVIIIAAECVGLVVEVCCMKGLMLCIG
jgi:hypothetical protein